MFDYISWYLLVFAGHLVHGCSCHTVKCRQGNVQVEDHWSTLWWWLERRYEEWLWNIQHSNWRWWLYQAVFWWLERQQETCMCCNCLSVCLSVCMWISYPSICLCICQCWCPQGKSLSLRILEDQFTNPYPCPCPCLWTTKSSKIVEDSTFCKQSVTYHVKSINLVTAAMQYSEEWSKLLISDITHWYISN